MLKTPNITLFAKNVDELQYIESIIQQLLRVAESVFISKVEEQNYQISQFNRFWLFGVKTTAFSNLFCVYNRKCWAWAIAQKNIWKIVAKYRFLNLFPTIFFWGSWRRKQEVQRRCPGIEKFWDREQGKGCSFTFHQELILRKSL